MITLMTERLIIRNFQAADWEPLHEMIVQYDASPYAAYDQPWPTSPDAIKGITEWFACGDHFLAICLKDSGCFIGFVALNPEQENIQDYNIGYVFNSNYHGSGYATEACRAVLNHGFHQLEARRVVTGTAAANQPSRRLLERLGFQKTGESMSSFRTADDGKAIEFLGYTYVITRDEWNQRLAHTMTDKSNH